ncbi:MAG: zinc ribbon domain-containing protein [Phycisphaerae bacterium]|nr:zinc ribbon domain-containing protein [Phycisphaerae bacterium]
MPNYEYECDGCKFQFEDIQSMSNDKVPCKNPCPECGEKKVRKGFRTAPVGGADATLTPDKATGGRWSEMMEKIKHSGQVAPKYHDKLDASTKRTGRRWFG